MAYTIDDDGFFNRVNGFAVQKQPADMPHTSYGAGFPKGILWHYTAGCNNDIKATLESNDFGGAPFNVGRDGSIHQYAPVFTATWHAREAGQYYIGIEHTSKGPGSDCPLTDKQLKASAALSAAIVEIVKDRKGFSIPLKKLAPPVKLGEFRPGFLDHTDGPNAIEAGGADNTWNDRGHHDALFRWTWPQYLGAVRAHLEDDMAAADDIIEGNRLARQGEKLPGVASKYMKWGFAEGERHVRTKERIEVVRGAVDVLTAELDALEAASGITEEAADARYAPVGHPHTGTAEVSVS